MPLMKFYRTIAKRDNLFVHKILIMSKWSYIKHNGINKTIKFVQKCDTKKNFVKKKVQSHSL